ncbi:hypothetical protein M885DRAFT_611231 [Pelagophyceae sp. CCMP2097]|nr:hypothetical protein M885DRAFT_611231 [Pelagophyceae sp. CCMP2097]
MLSRTLRRLGSYKPPRVRVMAKPHNITKESEFTPREFWARYSGADPYMFRAIEKFKQGKPYEIVVQVATAYAPQTAEYGRGFWVRNAELRVRCYTHADLVSDDVMLRIAQQAEAEDPEAAIMFLDCSEVKSQGQPKKFKNIRKMMQGAAYLRQASRVLVCGMPNVGKSSLVLPVTKACMQVVKKKKEYHLAKVNATAGSTVAVKAHRLDTRIANPVMMHDTPGLLPAREAVDEKAVVIMAAAGHLPKTAFFDGCPSKWWPVAEICTEALRGLNRHWVLCGSQEPGPAYMQCLGLDAPTDDYNQMLNNLHKHPLMNKRQLGRTEGFTSFLKMCREGHLGGWVLDDQLLPQTPILNHDALKFNPYGKDSPIVSLNARASELVSIGLQLRNTD